MGASCPNKINGGCIYCKDGSKANIVNSAYSLEKQYEEEAKILNQKWPYAKHIIYFQSGTNTYMDIEIFKKNVEIFLKYPEVVGISIATRSDCLNEEYYSYLKLLNEKTFLTVEVGLQTSNDSTLKLINRGHDYNNFKNAIKKLKENNIFTVAHIINGLPFETKNDMLKTAKDLNDLSIDGIKIHMLHILKSTSLEKLYYKTNFPILSKEEYIDIVISQLELLNEKIVIERITGDPVKEDLIAPTWLIKKFVLLNDIDKEMKKKDTYQGIKVKEDF